MSVAPRQEVPRRQLADAGENRPVARRVEEREKMIEGVEIQIAWQIRRLEQRLDLRSEVHAPADYSVVQRLDADAIARQQQGSRPLVPDRQTEHAAEPRDGIRSPL